MIERFIEPFSNITLIQALAFFVPFVIAVIIDLRSHKKGQQITMRDAAVWSGIWIMCALTFSGYIWFELGSNPAQLYVQGYLLEKALAVDNLFAFYLIFKSFGLTLEHNQPMQHRVLYWGILGAIILRIIFLGLGSGFLHLCGPIVLVAFAAVVLWTVLKMWKSSGDEEEVDYTKHWSVNFVRRVLDAFAAVVLWTVSKMWKSGGDENENDYTKHWSVNFVRRFAKVNPSIESHRFFSNGVTPLFLCLVCIEVCDMVFAFDSMPVIIGVVKDPYLMITASLWAAAGLRSLYFLLVAAKDKFWAIEKAVMILLIFVSFKLIGDAFHYVMPPEVSLGIVMLILIGGVAWSLIRPLPKENIDEISE